MSPRKLERDRWMGRIVSVLFLLAGLGAIAAAGYMSKCLVENIS
jgi:hypothetical protein